MNEQRKEVSLDPSDWSAMRALAHRAVDDAIDYLATVRDRPVWQPTPDSVIANEREKKMPNVPSALTGVISML